MPPPTIATRRRAIGQRIRARRAAAGQTQVQLADALGTTPRQVSCWEKGQDEPSMRDLRRVAASLGCEVRDLRPEDDE